VKLWVDDLRPAPEGWRWAKSSEEAIRYLSIYAWFGVTITEVSFDHDLGGDDTSRKVVLWMCENDYPWPRICRVHSANPPGVEWLEGMITRYAPPGTLRSW
jgi:hypothetical protein